MNKLNRNRTMNKRGIELSVNFIVILILAIAIFGGGIYLVYQIFAKAQNMKEGVDQQTEDRINALLDDGSPVVIPDVAKTGERGKLVYFYIGVSDNHKRQSGQPAMFRYRITASWTGGLNKNMVTFPGGTKYPLILLDRSEFVLEYGERKATSMAFDVQKDVAAGTHEYLVEVQYYDPTANQWTIHGTRQKVRVTVK
jgi:hypothetical protein